MADKQDEMLAALAEARRLGNQTVRDTHELAANHRAIDALLFGTSHDNPVERYDDPTRACRCSVAETTASSCHVRSEGAVSNDRLLHYDALGFRLYRNNSGVLFDKRGIPVRFGLGNVSSQVNERWKSPDHFGWEPRLVTPDMVGDVIALATGVEFKHEGWTPAPPTDRARYAHEQAQLAFFRQLWADGGAGGFDSGAGPIRL